MTFDDLLSDSVFKEFDENFYSVEGSHRATGKRTTDSMVSEIRSVVTGDPGCENQAIIAICESRGNLSEVGVAVYSTERNICLIQQVIQKNDKTFSKTRPLVFRHSNLLQNHELVFPVSTFKGKYFRQILFLTSL